MAEIGQVEIDRENAEKEENPELRRRNINGNINEGSNDPEGAGGDDLMAEGPPSWEIPSTPVEGPATEHFNMSPKASPKRRADTDDMEDDERRTSD